MTDRAPERIWLTVSAGSTDTEDIFGWSLHGARPHAKTEYVRADIVPSPPAMSGEAEEVVKALREKADHMDDLDIDYSQSAPMHRKAASLIERLAREIADYAECYDDHQRLTRELDIELNGAGAAKQASLCDLMGEIRRFKETQAAELAEARAALDGTLSLIHKAQERLCAYLIPDGDQDTLKLANEMLEMFDGPEQRTIESVARAALASRNPADGERR